MLKKLRRRLQTIQVAYGLHNRSAEQLAEMDVDQERLHDLLETRWEEFQSNPTLQSAARVLDCVVGGARLSDDRFSTLVEQALHPDSGHDLADRLPLYKRAGRAPEVTRQQARQLLEVWKVDDRRAARSATGGQNGQYFQTHRPQLARGLLAMVDNSRLDGELRREMLAEAIEFERNGPQPIGRGLNAPIVVRPIINDADEARTKGLSGLLGHPEFHPVIRQHLHGPVSLRALLRNAPPDQASDTFRTFARRRPRSAMIALRRNVGGVADHLTRSDLGVLLAEADDELRDEVLRSLDELDPDVAGRRRGLEGEDPELSAVLDRA